MVCRSGSGVANAKVVALTLDPVSSEMDIWDDHLLYELSAVFPENPVIPVLGSDQDSK